MSRYQLTRRQFGAVTIGALGPALATPSSTFSLESGIDVRQPGATSAVVTGVVFDDVNRDGVRQPNERGVAGVLVSNGLDVVRTDASGAYRLPVRDDMSVFVIKPSGWRTPSDRRQVPQFAYQHKPAGSSKALRFGGLAPTGPLPTAINFPLVRADERGPLRLAVIGDSQTYSGTEIGFFRDSTVNDLLSDGPGAYDGLLYLGDVVGDDLDLLDRVLEVGSVLGAPQYLVHGNHDYDFDAVSDADSSDTWRRIFGPNYYAFEIGQAFVIVLDNVFFPCGPVEASSPGRQGCVSDERPGYNGRVDETQMRWLANLLAEVPRDRLVVIAHHIPLVSFVDGASPIHQTDNLPEIHKLLEGRRALSLSGHTHTTENLAPGEVFGGWQEAVECGQLPFRHIIAGAASGAWYQGDVGIDGTPFALQRQGAPKGFLVLDLEGASYRETYYGANLGRQRQMWVSLSTPGFRRWYDALVDWKTTEPDQRDRVPPVNLNDLPDTKLLTRADLDDGTFLTVNVWLGSRETRVTAQIGEAALTLERTQEGAGEPARVGVDFADPFSAPRQLQVGRFALESRSGEWRNQGFELFRGTTNGPAPPQPTPVLSDRSMHLWRVRLPAGLADGLHVVTVTAVDRHGRQSTERMAFEVRASRPAPHWRREPWMG